MKNETDKRSLIPDLTTEEKAFRWEGRHSSVCALQRKNARTSSVTPLKTNLAKRRWLRMLLLLLQLLGAHMC